MPGTIQWTIKNAIEEFDIKDEQKQWRVARLIERAAVS
jgi:hypothetical protein